MILALVVVGAIEAFSRLLAGEDEEREGPAPHSQKPT